MCFLSLWAPEHSSTEQSLIQQQRRSPDRPASPPCLHCHSVLGKGVLRVVRCLIHKQEAEIQVWIQDIVDTSVNYVLGYHICTTEWLSLSQWHVLWSAMVLLTGQKMYLQIEREKHQKKYIQNVQYEHHICIMYLHSIFVNIYFYR